MCLPISNSVNIYMPDKYGLPNANINSTLGHEIISDSVFDNINPVHVQTTYPIDIKKRKIIIDIFCVTT